jgi:hypothetical protein
MLDERLLLYLQNQLVSGEELDAPISDSLSVRVAGRLSGMGGYAENGTLGRDGSRMRDAIGRISIRFKSSDSFRNDLRVDTGRLRSRDAFQVRSSGAHRSRPNIGQPRAGIAVQFPRIGPRNLFRLRLYRGRMDQHLGP